MKTADKTRETPAFPKTFIMAMDIWGRSQPCQQHAYLDGARTDFT